MHKRETFLFKTDLAKKKLATVDSYQAETLFAQCFLHLVADSRHAVYWLGIIINHSMDTLEKQQFRRNSI